MNYSEYKVLKTNLTRASRIIVLVPIIMVGGLLFQLITLIFKINTRFDYFNFSIIDQLYSSGLVHGSNGNMVLSVLFFGATLLCVIFIVACVVMAFRNKKTAYKLLIIFYLFDLVIAILSMSLIPMIVHLIAMVFLFSGYNVCKKLDSLPQDIWGYDE